MKILTITFAALFMLSTFALTEEPKTSSPENAVKVLTGTEKKSRKKKIEMCAECGKPESECECNNKNDGEKKSEKRESQEKGH